MKIYSELGYIIFSDLFYSICETPMSSDSEKNEEEGQTNPDIKDVCDSIIDSVCKQVRKAKYGDFKLFLGVLALFYSEIIEKIGYLANH